MAKKKIVVIGILFLWVFSWQAAAKTLPRSKPEKVGMSSQRLARMDGLLSAAVEEKSIPGAVVLVGRKGKIVYRKAFGESQQVPESRLMHVSTLFDLASITKPVATVTSIMILVERGEIHLRDKVKKFIPEFSAFREGAGKPEKDARIWHLLTHTAGLPPIIEAEVIKEKLGDPCKLEELTGLIARLDKLTPPGQEFLYGCLGFITLAYIIEKVSGENVAEFTRANIFSPLKMRRTLFNPPEELRPQCAATEVIEGEPLVGIVHDPRARLLGGISGNAGLFSNVDDLAIFAQMMLNKGEYDRTRILSPLSVERMTEIYPKVKFSGRGLGWDVDSPYSSNQGDLFGSDSYGHTGYTGTSLWIDPETQAFVIFLTNRVHPDDRNKDAIVSLRSRVANIVAASILE
jgi:CubicO group peptidase (beta-lactamase class C family)